MRDRKAAKKKRREARKQKKRAEKPRTCGDCRECCIHVAVESFDKPVGEPCRHILPSACGSCAIYQQRPSECRQYACSWLSGELPKQLKPNSSGLLFETSYIKWPRKITMLIGFETAPGSLKRSVLAEIANSLPSGTVALIIPHNQESPITVGREEDVESTAMWFSAVREGGELTQVAANGTFTRNLEDMLSGDSL